MKKINLVVAGVLAVSASHLFAQTAAPAAEPAAAAAAPTPDWTISGNMALSSDYRTRGISQTDKMPAISGGFDVAHVSGFYFGNWNSNIDSTYYNGANIEMDVWTGFRGTVGDVGYDIGAFYYYYPGAGSGSGSGLPGIDEKEIYVGASYGPVSARVYIPIGDFFSAEKIWNQGSATGSYYVDVSGSQSVGDGFSLIAHVGYQKLKGSAKYGFQETDGNLPNDYVDWKLGGSYTFGTGYVVTLVYIDTNIKARAYGAVDGSHGQSRIVSGATGVLSVSRTF